MTVNSGTDVKQTFTAPVTEDLSGKTPEAQKEKEPQKDTPKNTTEKSSFEDKSTVIGVKEMVDTKEKVATTIMKERIQNHMLYLKGERSFKNTDEQVTEQVSFIETIGNSLKLDYPQFAIITNELLNQIKENKETFREGTPFRFMSVLDKHYSSDIIEIYKTYIIFLTRLANNWTVRYKINELVDISFVIKDMDRKSKENLTRYFNELINS